VVQAVFAVVAFVYETIEQKSIGVRCVGALNLRILL
jgi:hypothetical protein